jgi:hypothetical protein
MGKPTGRPRGRPRTRPPAPPARTKAQVLEARAAKCEAFLAILAAIGNVTVACKRAKVGVSSVYEWRKSDEAFAKRWDELAEQGRDTIADAIEQSFDERAIEGWLEPVYQKGQLVGHVRKFDTVAGIVRLKALRPDKYRERSTVDLNVIPNMPARLDAAEKRLKNLKDEK